MAIQSQLPRHRHTGGNNTTLLLITNNTHFRHHRGTNMLSIFSYVLSACALSLVIPYVFANSELHSSHSSTLPSPDLTHRNRSGHSLRPDDAFSVDQTEAPSPSPIGCQSCMMRGELRNLSLAAIKEQILSKLGMKHAPNITGRPKPLLQKMYHILQMYGMQDYGGGSGGGGGGGVHGVHGMQSDAPVVSPVQFKPGPVVLEEEDDYHARTERVIAFAQQHPKLRHVWKSHDIQYFRFSEKVVRNRVLSALLWVYVRGSDYEFPYTSSSSASSGSSSTADVSGEPSADIPFNMSVLKVLRNGESKSDAPQLQTVTVQKKHRPRGQGGWVSIDIKGLITEWFRYPRMNLGIVIQGVDDQGRSVVVMDFDHEEGAMVPFVEVNTTDGRKHRTKRTIGLNCDESSEETRCCRYPLTVDFEEFGWDWIIAPKKYEANYCSGECPYVFLQKYPHTHIVHMANRPGTAGPCCAPRKMSPISMLYFDHEFNIIYGLLPGMVVDRCGCS